MTRFSLTLCAALLSMTLASPAFAGNIGGLRTNSTGNIGGMRTNSVGNIGGLRTNSTGNIGGLRSTSTMGSDSQTTDRQSQLTEGVFSLIRWMLESGALF